MVKQTVLCVDDEVDNVEALERLLRPKYEVLVALSAHEALKLIDQRPAGSIATIISDQRMPEMTGVELFRETLKRSPDCSRILLTGYTDIESIISAVNAGEIFRYITKPWDPVDLVATVDSGVERFQLTQELKTKNIALSQALDELKSLDRLKTEFMLLMGHELRTPLTSILNFSDLLSHEVPGAEGKKYLAHIQKAGQRLQSLTTDILFLLELSAGKTPVKKAPLDLAALIEKAAWAFPAEFQKRLVLKVSSEKVIADQDLLLRVFHELLDNAQKFARKEAMVEITGVVVGPHRLDIRMTSGGPPFSDAILHNLRSPFLMDKDLHHHSTGRGLGLAMTGAILKAHGCALSITNGTASVTVSFTLPFL